MNFSTLAKLFAFLLLLLPMTLLVFRQEKIEVSINTLDSLTLLETPAWIIGRNGEIIDRKYGDQILWRKKNKNGNSLLIRYTGSDTVYEYEPNQSALKPITTQQWEQANGVIVQCTDKLFSLPSELLRLDYLSHKLIAGKRVVPTAGQIVLNFAVSPDGKWVAVLSGEGSVRDSNVPFMAGISLSGSSYHQIFSLPNAVPFGKPLKVPVKGEANRLSPCWSADQQFILYFATPPSAYLSVLKTDLPTTLPL